MTRFRGFAFEQPNRGHPNVGRIRKFLLSPVKQPSGGSALGSRNHIQESNQSERFASIPLFFT